MLNKTPIIQRVSLGTASVLESTLQGFQGELAMCTDASNLGRLLVCPTTESGFVSPVVGTNKATITGSRSADTADILNQLLTALSNAGIITNSTTS